MRLRPSILCPGRKWKRFEATCSGWLRPLTASLSLSLSLFSRHMGLLLLEGTRFWGGFKRTPQGHPPFLFFFVFVLIILFFRIFLGAGAASSKKRTSDHARPELSLKKPKESRALGAYHAAAGAGVRTWEKTTGGGGGSDVKLRLAKTETRKERLSRFEHILSLAPKAWRFFSQTSWASSTFESWKVSTCIAFPSGMQRKPERTDYERGLKFGAFPLKTHQASRRHESVRHSTGFLLCRLQMPLYSASRYTL